MAWARIRRIMGKMSGTEAGGVPTPLLEEMAEMGLSDPMIAIALERRRERRRTAKDEVYARYGYLLFIPTNR